MIGITIYFSNIEKKSNQVLIANSFLEKKNEELKKIKHDYGSQISYLYGLHLMKKYDKLGDALKNIEQRFNQLKFTIPVAPLGVMFKPSEDELEKAFAFGHDFAKETLQCVNGGQCNIQAQ